ncbi:unnamed protein product [Ixodes pacificus]
MQQPQQGSPSNDARSERIEQPNDGECISRILMNIEKCQTSDYNKGQLMPRPVANVLYLLYRVTINKHIVDCTLLQTDIGAISEWCGKKCFVVRSRKN